MGLKQLEHENGHPPPLPEARLDKGYSQGKETPQR